MNEAFFYIIVAGFLLFIISGITKERKQTTPQSTKQQVIIVSDERYYKASQIVNLLSQYPDDHTRTLVLMELLPKTQQSFNEQSLTKSLDFVERVAGIVNKKPERKYARWQLL